MVEEVAAEEVMVVAVAAGPHLQQLQGLDREVAVHEVGGAVLRPRREHAVDGLALHRAVPSLRVGHDQPTVVRHERDGLGVERAKNVARVGHADAAVGHRDRRRGDAVARTLRDVMAQREVEADGAAAGDAAGLGLLNEGEGMGEEGEVERLLQVCRDDVAPDEREGGAGGGEAREGERRRAPLPRFELP